MESYNPLLKTRSLLEDIANRKDSKLLHGCLKGDNLPLTGSNEHPADTLFHALNLSPTNPPLHSILADLLADITLEYLQFLEDILQVSLRQTNVVNQVGGLLTTHQDIDVDEYYIFNIFLFATYLPANHRLFSSLKTFLDKGFATSVYLKGNGRAVLQLRLAIICHQTDDSLDDYWLSLLAKQPQDDASTLSRERQEELLEAWKGLLWIPPSDDQKMVGKIVNIDRIEQGLKSLFDCVWGTTDEIRLLRYAVRMLNYTFPRSPEFWYESFSRRVSDYQELLQEILVEQWPILSSELTAKKDLHLSKKAIDIWNLLQELDQDKIKKAADIGNKTEWDNLWSSVFFSSQPLGISPQDWHIGLNEIKADFENSYADLKADKKRLFKSDDMVDEDVSTEENNRPPKAINSLEALDRVNSALAEIHRLLQKRNKFKAEKYLSDLIFQQKSLGTASVHIAKTYCNAATSARETGYLEWSEELYQMAIKSNNHDAVIYSGLAETLKAQNRLEEAEELYRQTIAKWPNDIFTHTSLAEMLKSQNKFEEAEELYRQTIAKWPNNIVAHSGLADTLMAQDRLDEAEELYRKNLAKWPNNAFAHTGLAETLKAQDRLDEAEELYRQTIAKWPNNIVAHNGLADTLKAKDRLDEAEELYRKNLAKWPNDAFDRNGLADTLKAQDRLDEAEELYRKNLAKWPNDAFDRNGLADTLKAQDKLSEAEELYRQTIAKWPNEVVARNGLAETLKAQDKLSEAEELYRQTIAKWPNNIVAHDGLADTLKAQDRLDEAEELYRKNLARWPNDAFAHTGLAETLKAQDRLDEAEEFYRQTLAKWPKKVVAKHGLANILRKHKRYTDALSLLPETISTIGSQSRYDAHLRGMILLESGNVDEAIDIFQRFLKVYMRPVEQRIFRSALAVAHLRQKDYKQALTELEELPDNLPINVLRLHAYAEGSNVAQVQRCRQTLNSSGGGVPKSVKVAICAIETAYSLNISNGIIKPLGLNELDEVLQAEVDMLLAA